VLSNGLIETDEGIVAKVKDVQAGADDASVFLSELLIKKPSKPQLLASTTLIEFVVVKEAMFEYTVMASGMVTTE